MNTNIIALSILLLLVSTTTYSQSNRSSYYHLNALQQILDGGYILGGYSGHDYKDKGLADYWVVKTDGSGNMKVDLHYGGDNSDYLTSLQQTSDGGYILGGTSWSDLSGDKTENSRGGNDYWVVKIDEYGNKLWDKTFGGSSFDELQLIQQTSDGGYILGGYSYSDISGDKTENNKGNYDYWIVKIDANGNKQWDKTLGGNDEDYLTSLQQTSDGGYILGGYSLSNSSDDKTENNKGMYDYWIVKVDGSGNKQWDKTFGGNLLDALWSLQQTSDGGYILGGASYSGISGDKSEDSRGDGDYWVVKIDGSGNKQWDKTFGGNLLDYLTSLQQNSDGGYILGGTSWSDLSGDKTEGTRGSEDYWIVKIDANGNKQWDKTLGGSDNDELKSLQQTSDGGYILGGTSWSNISGDKTEDNRDSYDFWVVKIDESGNKQWDKTIGTMPVPECPSNVKAESKSPYSILVTWQNNSTNTAGFEIEWQNWHTSGSKFIWGADINSYTIDNLEPNTLYSLYVNAINRDYQSHSCGDSSYSKAYTTTQALPPVPDPAIVTVSYYDGPWTPYPCGDYNCPARTSIIKFTPKTLTGSVGKDQPFSITTTLDPYVYQDAMNYWWELTHPFDRLDPNNGLKTGTWTIELATSNPSGKNKVCDVTLNSGDNYINFYRDYNSCTTGTNPSPLFNQVNINSSVQVAKRTDEAKSIFRLKAYPNPFHDRILMEFSLKQEEDYSLDIFDAKGSLVQHLRTGRAQAGTLIQATWAPNLPVKGIYFIRLVTPSGVQHIQVILE